MTHPAMTEFKRAIRRLLGSSLVGTGLHRGLLRGRHTSVLFHRVDDRLDRNPISCTSREFREFCDFFQKYFEVISLGELCRRLRSGEPIGGTLSISFDDGYRDNRTIAAPILSERGLPATFFVTTGFIGTDRVTPWDRELGIRSEWMRWDDVRDLKEMGFELGAHTVNHVDLGKVHGPLAREEILESRARIEAETGAEVRSFSYPFGGVQHFTEANRELVRELEFECCLSAFGGIVGQDTDPFRLPRLPVSPWYRSAAELGFQIALGNNRRI
ncbi:MAG: polysaccharide deacetylase family protein [Gemmatimonadales bacterium]|nr:MAG: polysaccharide deacetylase family protein [Gemmatimonadales bacterium]